MKLSKDLQVWIVLSVVVIAGLYGFFAFFYFPLGKKIKASQTELQDKSTKLESARDIAKKYEQAKYQQSQLINMQAYLDKKLGGVINNGKLESEISQIMAAAHVSYSNFKSLGVKPPLKRSAGGIDYTALYTEIVLNTNYHDFCNLLTLISTISVPTAGYVLDMNYQPSVIKPKEDLRVNLALLVFQMPSSATASGSK